MNKDGFVVSLKTEEILAIINADDSPTKGRIRAQDSFVLENGAKASVMLFAHNSSSTALSVYMVLVESNDTTTVKLTVYAHDMHYNFRFSPVNKYCPNVRKQLEKYILYDVEM